MGADRQRGPAPAAAEGRRPGPLGQPDRPARWRGVLALRALARISGAGAAVVAAPALPAVIPDRVAGRRDALHDLPPRARRGRRHPPPRRPRGALPPPRPRPPPPAPVPPT